MLVLTLDWVFVYDLVALLGGIVLGVFLMNPHHHLHVEMDDEE
jgi:hypothetical protein